MYLAIMAWAVCWKKVVMENSLNILVGFWGFLQSSQPFLFLNIVSDCTTERNRSWHAKILGLLI